ncbi:conserved hypothetical protein [Vibrio phage 424E50-1]|nr:conserved hypothetical protein [Vibrio phage 424E50-1]
MNFTLSYTSTEDKYPDHKSNIIYYVMNNTYMMEQSVHQQSASVYYEWFSDNAEVNEYYDPETESHYKVGDTRQATYYEEGDKEDHRMVRLVMCFKGEGRALWCHEEEHTPILAWNYAHDVQREISKHQKEGNYFPCFDINNLLREGIVKVITHEQAEVGAEGEKYYHVYADVKYKGGLFHLRMAQGSKWENDTWVNEKNGKNVYGKVGIFTYKCISPSTE